MGTHWPLQQNTDFLVWQLLQRICSQHHMYPPFFNAPTVERSQVRQDSVIIGGILRSINVELGELNNVTLSQFDSKSALQSFHFCKQWAPDTVFLGLFLDKFSWKTFTFDPFPPASHPSKSKSYHNLPREPQRNSDAISKSLLVLPGETRTLPPQNTCNLAKQSSRRIPRIDSKSKPKRALEQQMKTQQAKPGSASSLNCRARDGNGGLSLLWYHINP